MKYRVVIGSTQADLEIEDGPGSLFTVTFEGKTHVAEVQYVDGAEIFSMIVDGESWEFLAHRDESTYNIIIHGQTYSARIYEGALAGLSSLAAGRQGAATEQQLVAAMPGVVVEVLARVGDQVEQGTVLLIVESMKMNNPVKAPRPGRIKSVSARKGLRVNKGDVLAVLE